MPRSDDPWQWSVEEVIAQLCHRNTLFVAAGQGLHNTPNPAMFEANLRARRIDGATLLTQVTNTALRERLGILLPSHRQAILAVINTLRARSTKYKQSATASVQSLSISDPGPSHTTAPNVAEGSSRKRKRVAPTVMETPQETRRMIPITSTSSGASRVLPLGGGVNIEAGGDWDYLAAKYKDDEGEILEPLPDSGPRNIDFGSEDDDNADEENLDLYSNPHAPEISPKGKTMKEQDVADIINDCIEKFTEAWFPGKDEDEAYDAHELWHEAESVGERLELIERTKTDIRYFEDRLDQICAEIAKVPWHGATALRHQCKSLQSTVESLEQEKWELSVYNRAVPPPKVDFSNVAHNAVPPMRIIDVDDSDPEAEDVTGPLSSDDEVLENEVLDDEDLGRDAPPIRLDTIPATQIIDLGSGSDSSQTERENVPLLSGEAFGPGQGDFTIEEPNIPVASVELDSPKPKPRRLPTPAIYYTPSPPVSSIQHNDEPEDASFNTVSRWEWEHLVEKADRKRIVMKVLQEMSYADRELIRTRVHAVQKAVLLSEIPSCIAMLVRRDNNIPGMLARDLERVVKFTKLFLCWWLADNYYCSKEATSERLKELVQCLDEGTKDLSLFYYWLVYVLGHTFSKEALAQPFAPSQAEIITISSDDEAVACPKPTQRKKQGKKSGGQ